MSIEPLYNEIAYFINNWLPNCLTLGFNLLSTTTVKISLAYCFKITPSLARSTPDKSNVLKSMNETYESTKRTIACFLSSKKLRAKNCSMTTCAGITHSSDCALSLMLPGTALISFKAETIKAKRCISSSKSLIS